MKKLLVLIVSITLFTACENTWDSDARDMFVRGCEKSAKDKMSEENAKAMCECRLEVMMDMYPNFSKAMENLDKVMADTSFLKCEPEY